MRARPQWHLHMRVGGENVQIDLSENFASNEEVIDWVDEYFQDQSEWITLPQIASKTEVTMVRKKEVKILTIKYW